jgi:hypothetical protein
MAIIRLIEGRRLDHALLLADPTAGELRASEDGHLRSGTKGVPFSWDDEQIRSGPLDHPAQWPA